MPEVDLPADVSWGEKILANKVCCVVLLGISPRGIEKRPDGAGATSSTHFLGTVQEVKNRFPFCF